MLVKTWRAVVPESSLQGHEEKVEVEDIGEDGNDEEEDLEDLFLASADHEDDGFLKNECMNATNSTDKLSPH